MTVANNANGFSSPKYSPIASKTNEEEKHGQTCDRKFPDDPVDISQLNQRTRTYKGKFIMPVKTTHKIEAVKMDGYTEPKDAKKWVQAASRCQSNSWDQGGKQESCSSPYKGNPESDGRVQEHSTKPAVNVHNFSTMASNCDNTTNVNFDYDTPPSRHSNGSDLTRDCSAPKADVHLESLKNSPNHKPAIGTVKTDQQESVGSHSSSSDISVHDTSTAVRKRTANEASKSTSSALDNSSVVLRQESADGQKRWSRQRVMYPSRQSSSCEIPDSSSCCSTALYQEPWDSSDQQRKLEENLRLARSISNCSEKFEDALEYLQSDDPAQVWQKGTSKGTGGDWVSGQKVDPVNSGVYEQAWDLNRGLEEKLRSLQLMHSENVSKDGGDGAYLEPWDTARQQRELEEKILIHQTKSKSEDGHNQKTLQHQQSAQPAPADIYEEAWDLKKSISQQILQSSQSHSNENSVGSSRTVHFPVGEPVNAMISLHNQDWYHGNISRENAEEILRVCKDGSYLVRDSSDRCHYTLSIKSPQQTIHIQIDQCYKSDGSFRFILGKNSKAFDTIPSMIDHYTHHAVPIKGANHMALLFPVKCNWS